jgi:hypothetical protein
VQYGFRLVVSVVPKKNPVRRMAGERIVTDASRRRFDALSGS